jgi:hypothetical protein
MFFLRVPGAAIHHFFFIQYFRRLSSALFFSVVMLLCVTSAFLIDHQSYFTAGMTAMIAIGALTMHVVHKFKSRHQARIEAHKMAELIEQRAERKAAAAKALAERKAVAAKACAEKIEEAKTLTVQTTKRLSSGAVHALESAKTGLSIADNSDAAQKAKTVISSAASTMKAGVGNIAKTGIMGARDRLMSRRGSG